MKTRSYIILFTVLLICCAAALLLFRGIPNGTTARIYVDGVCIRTVDLSAVTAPETFTVETEWGSNTVCVELGRICICEADCADKICVQTGWLSKGTVPIVCLPHHLVISLEGENGAVDAVSG